MHDPCTRGWTCNRDTSFSSVLRENNFSNPNLLSSLIITCIDFTYYYPFFTSDAIPSRYYTITNYKHNFFFPFFLNIHSKFTRIKQQTENQYTFPTYLFLSISKFQFGRTTSIRVNIFPQKKKKYK